MPGNTQNSMRLQVLYDAVPQASLASSLPPAAGQSHAAVTVHRPVIDQQERITVSAPYDDDVKIDFWVPIAPPAAASIETSQYVLPSRMPQDASGAEASWRVWKPSDISHLMTVSRTVLLLRQMTHPPSAHAQPVGSPVTICAQPWRKVVSVLFGFPVSGPCLSGALGSSSAGRSATGKAKKVRRRGGLTFCGKPNKVACWLAHLCDSLPGLPISDSELWALGTGTHIHSPLRLAGLQELGH